MGKKMKDFKIIERRPISDNKVIANIKINQNRKLPFIKFDKPHNRTMIICGNGPSLSAMLNELKQEVLAGGDLFSINGAADWLNSIGIRSRAMILLDHNIQTASFLQNVEDPFDKYYVATRVHPDVLDILQDCDVELWHNSESAKVDKYAEPDSPVVYGGGTAMLRAFHLGFILGYRKFAVYGCDSNVSDAGFYVGKHKGHRLILNNKRYKARCGNRTFISTLPMIQQAATFFNVLDMFKENPIEVRVMGDGLLSEVCKQYPNAKIIIEQ